MSSNRHHYATGAVRSADCQQTRYDLISPIGLEAVARTYAEGANKFGPANWENGMPVTDLLNHAIAHIFKWVGGCRKEDHIPHAIWNLLAVLHSLELWPELNEGWLRGPGCTCPPAARKATKKKRTAKKRTPKKLAAKKKAAKKRPAAAKKR